MPHLPITFEYIESKRKEFGGSFPAFPFGDRYCRDGKLVSDYLLASAPPPSEQVFFSAISEWLLTTDLEDLGDLHFMAISIMGSELFITSDYRPSAFPMIGQLVASYVLSNSSALPIVSIKLSNLLMQARHSKNQLDSFDCEELFAFSCIVEALSGRLHVAKERALQLGDLDIFFNDDQTDSSFDWNYVLKMSRTDQFKNDLGFIMDCVLKRNRV